MRLTLPKLGAEDTAPIAGSHDVTSGNKASRVSEGKRSRRKRSPRPLMLERLDARSLLAAGFMPFDFDDSMLAGSSELRQNSDLPLHSDVRQERRGDSDRAARDTDAAHKNSTLARDSQLDRGSYTNADSKRGSSESRLGHDRGGRRGFDQFARLQQTNTTESLSASQTLGSNQSLGSVAADRVFESVGVSGLSTPTNSLRDFARDSSASSSRQVIVLVDLATRSTPTSQLTSQAISELISGANRGEVVPVASSQVVTRSGSIASAPPADFAAASSPAASSPAAESAHNASSLSPLIVESDAELLNDFYASLPTADSTPIFAIINSSDGSSLDAVSGLQTSGDLGWVEIRSDQSGELPLLQFSDDSEDGRVETWEIDRELIERVRNVAKNLVEPNQNVPNPNVLGIATSHWFGADVGLIGLPLQQSVLPIELETQLAVDVAIASELSSHRSVSMIDRSIITAVSEHDSGNAIRTAVLAALEPGEHSDSEEATLEQSQSIATVLYPGAVVVSGLAAAIGYRRDRDDSLNQQKTRQHKELLRGIGGSIANDWKRLPTQNVGI